MLIVFFIVLPVLGVFAILFQPVRWLFMLCALGAIAAMWMLRSFLLPGRLILSAIYGLMTVFTLVMALGARPATQRAPSFVATPEPPQVVTTPQFNASTMGTNVPADYYVTAEPAGDPPGYSDSYTGNDGLDASGDAQTDSGVYVPGVKTESEIALENFMEHWRRGIIADMVQYTAPSWRDAQQDSTQADAAAKQLFWKFGNKTLTDWRQMSAPSGTDASGSRTITVQADIDYYNSESRTYEYEAIVLCEDGKWYVDPNSLSSGILREAATPTPDPNVTPTPTPAPTPTPTPGPKTKLYYNKNGGRKYHADPECYTVDKKYLPLASFTYNQLGKYPSLEPCDKCDAPARP